MTSEKVTLSTVTKNKVQTERKVTKTLGKVRNVGRISSKNEITFKIWNIHGLKSSTINAIKNKSDSFLNNIFNDSDFVIFTETWSDKGDGDLFLWDDDFEEKFRELGLRNSRRGRSSWGGGGGGYPFVQGKYLIVDTKFYQAVPSELGVDLTDHFLGGIRILLYAFCIFHLPIVTGLRAVSPLILIN